MPEIRAAQPTEALNATLADAGRFVTKMGFQRVSHPRSRTSFELVERLNRAWRKHDLVAHSGYNIARTYSQTTGRVPLPNGSRISCGDSAACALTYVSSKPDAVSGMRLLGCARVQSQLIGNTLFSPDG